MLNSFHEKIVKKLEKFSPEIVKDIVDQEFNEIILYKNILDSIAYSVVVVNNEQEIVYYNGAAARLFGFHNKRFKGKKVLALSIDKEIKEKIREVLNGSKIINHEITLSGKKADVVNMSAFPLTRKKAIDGYIFTIHDITESLTEKLRTHHKESIKSLAVLTAGVAHEIKNPLGSLDLHIQLINRFLKENVMSKKDQLSELVNVVDDEIKRLDKIVNDFLFSVRPIKIQPKSENLNNIISDLLTFLEPEFETKNIQIVKELSNEIEDILLDKNYIKQALMNIIQNAVSSMEKNKEDAELVIHTNQIDDKIILSISDNGSGIPKDILNKIFEPFFSTKEMGTGLGLTIVYKIIQEHCGEIVLSSEKGKGTEFRIEFSTAKKKVKLLSDMRGL
jgi:PAS domain S-box-containing protein